MDLDGDGYVDLLSGSWPGEIFFFKGGPNNTFAAPITLQDKTGEVINAGGGMQTDPEGGILIAGNATFEKDNEGDYALYHGKKIRSTPERPVSITGTASAVHAADWDGDGVLDLLIGDIRGNVYLLPNEGTKTRYAFGKHQHLQAGGKPICVDGGDAGPFVADWDQDGKPDLLLGAGDGSVWFFRNVGTKGKPQLAAGKQLIPPGSIEYGKEAPGKPTRGIRAKVCVTDWNGDGRLDLLVGDFATQKPDRPEPTPAEKAEHDKMRAQMQTLENRFRELISKVRGPSRTKDKDEYEKIGKELKEVSKTMGELNAKLPQEYETRGWVWLFLRRPVEKQ